MPPKGIPPFSLIGFALVVVMVSKQGVKETAGGAVIDMDIGLLDAGLLEVQGSEDVRMQDTRSADAG